MPLEVQGEWIRAGLGVLRGHGLTASIWVAPRHGFDENTLKALRAEGIGWVSDGWARVPFQRGGVTWIPQQLWGPVEKPTGLWTICVHPNSADDRTLEELRGFLVRHAESFTSVERVAEAFDGGDFGLVERAYEVCAGWRMAVRRRLQGPVGRLRAAGGVTR